MASNKASSHQPSAHACNLGTNLCKSGAATGVHNMVAGPCSPSRYSRMPTAKHRSARSALPACAGACQPLSQCPHAPTSAAPRPSNASGCSCCWLGMHASQGACHLHRGVAVSGNAAAQCDSMHTNCKPLKHSQRPSPPRSCISQHRSSRVGSAGRHMQAQAKACGGGNCTPVRCACGGRVCSRSQSDSQLDLI